MLTNVHVKNLALIDSADIFFSEGLNILSGETGAGKSILMGAIHLALGGKFSKEMIRSGCNEALAELSFCIDNESQRNALRAMDISFDEEIVLTRKICDGRSFSRINGEAASLEKLRNVAELLMNIHTQRENQTLLNQRKQLDIIDLFAGNEAVVLKARVSAAYDAYMNSEKEVENFSVDESSRAREISLLEFEINEISEINPIVGEDEELEFLYKRLINSKKITEELVNVYSLCGYDEGAGAMLGRACMSLATVDSYDDKLGMLNAQLTEIDNLLNDFNRDISDSINDYEFDEESFHQTEERLNSLNHIKMKYGKTISEVLDYKKEKEIRLAELMDYEENLRLRKEELEIRRKEFISLCDSLSQLRRTKSELFKDKLLTELLELNFLKVDLDIQLLPANATANGADKVLILVSFNPGEEMHPIERIASGGELSRFMLAVKTVLSDNDLSKTLLFDEIDSGISGITAQKVSERLGKIAFNHQVICITHLPQIAAMANRHFKIEKMAINGETLTSIEALDRDGEIAELARMLSGEVITPIVLENATDLKNAASLKKVSYNN